MVDCVICGDTYTVDQGCYCQNDDPEVDVFRDTLRAIRDGYGTNHLSKFARDVATKALSSKETE